MLEVEVSTNAREFGILGRNPWTNRLKIRLVSPPSEGRANRELEQKLSEAFSAPAKIIQGLKSSKKTVLVETCEKELLKRLEGYENRAGKA